MIFQDVFEASVFFYSSSLPSSNSFSENWNWNSNETHSTHNIDQMIVSYLYFLDLYVGARVRVYMCVGLTKPKTSVKYEIKFIEVNKNKWAD